MGESARSSRRPIRSGAAMAGVCAVLVAAVLAGCSSTDTGGTSSSGSAAPAIPSSAFSDHTGVTSSSVTVANVSTLTAGLFKGGAVGTEAYAAYVNSQGGVNGRKLVVQSADDAFQGAINKQLTTAALGQAFALVGGVSLEDSFGGTVLEANPQFPNVSESLDPKTEALPNTFSAIPAGKGWPLGPLDYFKATYPDKIEHTATIIADLPSTETAWSQEKATMEHLGYQVLYDPALPPTQTDFTQQVVAMKNAGVQILFLEQEPENYASSIFKDLTQQNFHPTVVLGAPAYIFTPRPYPFPHWKLQAGARACHEPSCSCLSLPPHANLPGQTFGQSESKSAFPRQAVRSDRARHSEDYRPLLQAVRTPIPSSSRSAKLKTRLGSPSTILTRSGRVPLT